MSFFPSSSIMCWNVLHGSANIYLSYGSNTAYVIDFGVHQRYIYYEIVKYAVKHGYEVLSAAEHRDIFITHLHYDHYSLLPYIANGLSIHSIYLPVIPCPEPIAEKILYLYAFLIVRVPGYRVFRDILEKGKNRVIGLTRGDVIELHDNLYMKILWPPRTLPPNITKKFENKLKKVHEEIKEEARKEGIEKDVNEIFEYLKRVLMPSKEECEGEEYRKIKDQEVSEGSSVIWKTKPEKRRKSVRDEIDSKIKRVLRIFRGIANHISLVLKVYHGNPLKSCSKAIALIPGDASDAVLNYVAELEKGEPSQHKYLIFLRAAHHGTHYGKYIDEHSSIVAWISWTSRIPLNLKTSKNLEKYLLNPRLIIKLLAESLKKVPYGSRLLHLNIELNNGVTLEFE